MGLIIDRVKRLIAANVRELVEAASDPEIELLEFAANTERSYGEIKAELMDVANGAAHLEKQFLETQALADGWVRKAQAALRQNEEDLAREALQRKAHTEALVAHIAAELKDQLELSDSLRSALGQLQDKLREAQTQRDRLLKRSARAAVAKRAGDVLQSKHLWLADPSAERLSEDILQQRHRLEAYLELHQSTVESRFRALAPKKDIEIQLKRLKAQLLKDKKP